MVEVPDSITVHDSIAGFRTLLDRERATGRTVGFVPTMGYLHDGHASLMRAAASECDLAVASIFVNPLQFAAHEDLSTYPRDLHRDLVLAAEAGVTHVLHPTVEEMYPRPVLTTVTVAEITRHFEGASRPEHFAGVATVVSKLLAIVGPCRAYFGDKDYQQLAVVTRLASDLSFPAEIIGCPIVREPDGVAMSSRNVYLSATQRTAAPVLHRALTVARDLIAGGETDADRVRATMAEVVAREPEAVLDYADLVDAESLARAESAGGDQRLLIAAHFGATRLLDNMPAS